jgi:hypothetical protein
MTILSQKLENEYLISKNIEGFFKENSVGEILTKSNARKAQGIGVLRIFGALLMLIFTGKSLNRLISENSFGFSKDTFYRFLNSVRINWHTFLSLLSLSVIQKIIPLTTETRINTLILDDTIFKRNRSKNVELLTKVQDHNDGRYYKGFRCLTAGFSDGNTFIPTGFNLLSSQNEKTRINEATTKIDKRTNGYKRRVNAQISMYDAAYELTGRAQNAKIPFSHVLFDSWFSMPVFFRTLLNFNVHGIGMLKSTPNIFYYIGKKAFTLKTLHDLVSKKIPNNKDKFSITVTLRGDGREKKDVSLKILFIHDIKAKNNWLAIGTTDLTLSDEQIVTLYSRRWDIEVFFKACKQFLGFAKDFEGRNYDVLNAQVAISYTRYMMLATTVRQNTDMRTGGDLFYAIYDELRENSMSQAMLILLEYLTLSLQKFFAKSTINNFQTYFFASLPSFIKDLLQIPGCES